MKQRIEPGSAIVHRITNSSPGTVPPGAIVHQISNKPPAVEGGAIVHQISSNKLAGSPGIESSPSTGTFVHQISSKKSDSLVHQISSNKVASTACGENSPGTFVHQISSKKSDSLVHQISSNKLANPAGGIENSPSGGTFVQQISSKKTGGDSLVHQISSNKLASSPGIENSPSGGTFVHQISSKKSESLVHQISSNKLISPAGGIENTPSCTFVHQINSKKTSGDSMVHQISSNKVASPVGGIENTPSGGTFVHQINSKKSDSLVHQINSKKMSPDSYLHQVNAKKPNHESIVHQISNTKMLDHIAETGGAIVHQINKFSNQSPELGGAFVHQISSNRLCPTSATVLHVNSNTAKYRPPPKQISLHAYQSHRWVVMILLSYFMKLWVYIGEEFILPINRIYLIMLELSSLKKRSLPLSIESIDNQCVLYINLFSQHACVYWLCYCNQLLHVYFLTQFPVHQYALIEGFCFSWGLKRKVSILKLPLFLFTVWFFWNFDQFFSLLLQGYSIGLKAKYRLNNPFLYALSKTEEYYVMAMDIAYVFFIGFYWNLFWSCFGSNQIQKCSKKMCPYVCTLAFFVLHSPGGCCN